MTSNADKLVATACLTMLRIMSECLPQIDNLDFFDAFISLFAKSLSEGYAYISEKGMDILEEMSRLDLEKPLRGDLGDVLDLIGKCNKVIFSFNKEAKMNENCC